MLHPRNGKREERRERKKIDGDHGTYQREVGKGLFSISSHRNFFRSLIFITCLRKHYFRPSPPPLNKVTNCTTHCQRESSNNLSHNINIFSVAFSCLILYTAHHHNHSFLLAPGFQLTTHSFSLPNHLHKKPELFLLIRWLSILHSMQHQSPHSPAFGRSTWSCSRSSVGSTDLSNSV